MKLPSIAVLALFLPFAPLYAAEPPIKVGVQAALTGDLAASGTDERNAVMLVNEKLGGRYELLVQDDRCASRDAMSIARKFIDEGVRYVVGFTCNQTLISNAPVYEKAGVMVLSSGGTSGDIPDLGAHNFRVFPSDYLAGKRLFEYIRPRHKSLVMVTENTEYATMMDRSFQRLNREAGSPLELTSYSFTHGDTDLRTLMLKVKASHAEAVFLNADSDSSFISMLKELAPLKYDKPRYAAYWGASDSVLKEVPALNEGIVFSNLPTLEELFSAEGKQLLAEFRRRFGEPKSGFPTLPIAMESMRLLDWALKNNPADPAAFLRGRSIKDGYLPPYSFDEHGNVVGIAFQMQRVRGGKVEVIEK